MDICKFVERHGISPLDGKPIKLMKFQREILKSVLNADSSVKTQNLCLWGAKKNSKSFLIGCIFFYLLFYRKNTLSVCMSANEAQSRVIYDSILETFGESILFQELKVLKNSITHEQNKNEIRVLNRSTNCNGLRVSNLAISEIFTFDDKNWEQFSVLEKSLVLQSKPLMLVDSNSPSEESSRSIALLKTWKKSKKWIVKEFVADRRLNPGSLKAWKQANPFLENKKFKDIVLENYKESWKKAQQDRRSLADFYRFCLGWPATYKNDSFLDVNRFNWSPQLLEKVFTDENMQFVLGIDLATRFDATALTLCSWIPLDEGEDLIQDIELFCYPKIYYGQIKNKNPHMIKKVRGWAREGFVDYHNEEVINQRKILDEWYSLFRKFPVITESLTISIDPAYSHQWVNELTDQGFIVKKRFFSPKYTTPGIRRVQRICDAGKLHWLTKENPALIFHANSCVTNEQSKNYTSLKRLNNNVDLSIDAMCSLVLAVSELVETAPKQEAMFF